MSQIWFICDNTKGECSIVVSSFNLSKSFWIIFDIKGISWGSRTFSSKKNLLLLAIDTTKTKNGFEFNLLFSNNGFITLSSEIIEVTLEDLKEIKNDL